ncbi:MAG: AAA family ATPase [Actinobacteria bacterium]|nr:AAA family ATPase [Actinomycetota bacterium]MBM2828067.1 family ATPase [Actinomycetota bacterium]
MHRKLENVFYEVRSPKLSWGDIGGLAGPKAKMKEMVSLPLARGERLREMGVDLPSGVMLWGPLGLGITMLAEASAKDAGATFVYVSGQEMLGKIDRMEEAFGIAVREAPSVFFISDIDWLCPRAGASYEWRDGTLRGKPPTFADISFTGKFLALLDSLLHEPRVRLVGSCYRIDVVDQAAIKEKKRFNRKIFVPPPTAEDRREILAIYAGRMPLTEDVDLGLIAGKAEGCTGWDIENLCRKAAILAVEECEDRVALRHFLAALSAITPWLTPDMTEGYLRIFREDCPHHYSF